MGNKLVLSGRKSVRSFLVIFGRDRVYISSLIIPEEFFVNNIFKYSFANCKSAGPTQDAVLVTLI